MGKYIDYIFKIIAILIPAIVLIETRKAKKEARRPDIDVESIIFETDKVEVYGGKNVEWAKKPLTYEYLKKIRNTSMSNNVVDFGGVKYFLINMCEKETPDEEIGLILNAFNICFENNVVDIDEISIVSAYSISQSKNPVPTYMDINTTLNIGSADFSLPIAYACPYGNYYINSPRIAELACSDDKKHIILYSKDRSIDATPERAREIFVFSETAYLFKCVTANSDTYEYTLWIKRDVNTGLQKPRIWRKNFFDKKVKEHGNNIKINP